MGVCMCVNPHPNCPACGSYGQWNSGPSNTNYWITPPCNPHCFCAEAQQKPDHKICCKCYTVLHKKFVPRGVSEST